jgi:hypothetical protein
MERDADPHPPLAPSPKAAITFGIFILTITSGFGGGLGWWVGLASPEFQGVFS